MNTSTVNNINMEADAAMGRIGFSDIVVLASPCAGSAKVLYMLMPVTVGLLQLQKWSRSYGCNIVAVSGFDWDNDMTPWSAPNLTASRPPFMGHAAGFLSLLTDRIVPLAEEALGVDGAVERTICGISLSGLFALWAWLVDRRFSNVASISGALWYDGFVDWVDAHVNRSDGKACFTVGDLEGGINGNARFAGIQEDTRRIVDTLGHAGIDARLATGRGNHFAPVTPRIESMLGMLYSA